MQSRVSTGVVAWRQCLTDVACGGACAASTSSS